MVFTLATDFSGIDAPAEALKQLGIKFKYLWASECNKLLHPYIQMHGPRILLTDARKSKHLDVKERVDLYVAGPPCQRYSSLTQACKQFCGIKACIDVIRAHRPTRVIIENVAAASRKLEHMRKKCSELGYTTALFNLSPHEIGFPQRRRRCYLMCTLGRIVFAKKPRSIKLSSLLSCRPKGARETTNKFLLKYRSKYPGHIMNATMGSRVMNGTREITPSMASRTVCPCLDSLCMYAIYLVDESRYLTVRELARIQGFRHINLRPLGTKNASKAMGNSMCVRVIRYLIKSMPCIPQLP